METPTRYGAGFTQINALLSPLNPCIARRSVLQFRMGISRTFRTATREPSQEEYAHVPLRGLQRGEGCRLHAPGARTLRPCRIVQALGEQPQRALPAAQWTEPDTVS